MGDPDITVRPVEEADLDALIRHDLRAFGANERAEWLEQRVREDLELDRFVVAEAGGRIVGNAGAFSFGLTLPGGAEVPVAGVTWVAVSATHRRRGVMRSMLDDLHAQARDRGEVAAVLWAAEGSIYGNVGYGPTHREQVVHVSTGVQFRADAPSGGSVQYAEPGESRDILPAVWDRVVGRRAGGLRRSPAWWANVLRRIEGELAGVDDLHHTVVHLGDDGRPDGYAVYHSDGKWDPTSGAANTVWLDHFAAETPVAHAELWRVLTSLDLVDRIETDQVPLEDPLPWLLEDGRGVAVRQVADGMWLRILDVAGVFGSRTWAGDDAVVVDAAALGRWRLGATRPERTDAPADVSMSPVELGAVSLGGTRVVELALAGRVREHTTGAARRFDALLATDPAPACLTHF